MLKKTLSTMIFAVSTFMASALLVPQGARALEVQNRKVRTVAREPEERMPASNDESHSSGFGLHRLTFDLGISTGEVNEKNYTEANLGLNAYFYEWFAWRNALFGRFASGEETIYGLDSSGRFVLNLDGGVLGLTAFAGPGWRFINKGGNAPLIEAGLVFRLAGITLGGGMKTIINSSVRTGAANDTQYFLILAGGGSL